MDIKKWNALSREMLPLLDQMIDVLNKHDFGKIYAPAISADGYVSVCHIDHIDGEKAYRFYRHSKDYPTEIDLNFEDIKEEADAN